MSSVVVALSEFNPDLLELMVPTGKNAKNGTSFKRADIKYQGKNLILDIPMVDSTGVIWITPKDGGYPKPSLIIDWDEKVNSNAAEILKGYDTVFCAIFRKLAPYGELFGQSMMQAHANHAYPEKMDQPSEVLKMMGMPSKTNREVFCDILGNFFDYPKFSKETHPNDRKSKDYSKSMQSFFYLRKAVNTTEENGGYDPYDCQFKIATKENEPSIPWKELKGDLKHTYRHAITHVYINGGNTAIQKRISSSTVYSLSKSGGVEAGYMPGNQDEKLKQNLDQGDMEKIMALYMMMKNAAANPTPAAAPSTSGTPQATMPPKEEPKPDQLPSKMEDLVKSVSSPPPKAESQTPPAAGGGMNLQGMNPEMMKKMMEMLGK